jgi:hypothetical protein
MIRTFARRELTCQRRLYSSKSSTDPLKLLTDQFKDPSTPYYLAPGTSGPAHEDDHQGSSWTSLAEHVAWPTPSEPDYSAARRSSAEHAIKQGLDVRSRVEVQVAWGEEDKFRYPSQLIAIPYESAADLLCRSGTSITFTLDDTLR